MTYALSSVPLSLRLTFGLALPVTVAKVETTASSSEPTEVVLVGPTTQQRCSQRRRQRRRSHSRLKTQVNSSKEVADFVSAEDPSRRTTVAFASVTEDLYCDDDLVGGEYNDNIRLSWAENAADGAVAHKYPAYAVLTDYESILSLDASSAGPTSLLSNVTDDPTTEDDDDESDTATENSQSSDVLKASLSAKVIIQRVEQTGER